MRTKRVQRASAQFDNSNGRLGPHAMFACPLNPTLFVFCKKAQGKELSHHWSATLCAADLLMTIVRPCCIKFVFERKSEKNQMQIEF